MSESEISDAGGGGGGPIDAATTIDGKSRLHLLTCLLHLVRLVPRCIQPHWLQVPPPSPTPFMLHPQLPPPPPPPFPLAYR